VRITGLKSSRRRQAPTPKLTQKDQKTQTEPDRKQKQKKKKKKNKKKKKKEKTKKKLNRQGHPTTHKTITKTKK